jgi:hypothetical protein
MFEFMAYDSTNTDVALGKPTSQSSTLANKSKFLPGKAVDGDMATFSHTDTADTSATWEVDLGQDYTITSVSVFNRWCVNVDDGPACLCRLSRATVELLDDVDRVIASARFGDTCGDVKPALDYNTCAVSSSLLNIYFIDVNSSPHLFHIRPALPRKYVWMPPRRNLSKSSNSEPFLEGTTTLYLDLPLNLPLSGTNFLPAMPLITTQVPFLIPTIPIPGCK